MMIRKSVTIIFWIAILAASVAVAVAQPKATRASEPLPAFPFAVGESLTYEGKLSKIIQGISVAELTFTVNEAPDSDHFLIKAEARSKGTLLKLFRYSFLQQIDSTIDRKELFAYATAKHDVQKDRVRDSLADFDYDESRVTYVETDPNEPMRPPRHIASELAGETHDLISGIYLLRTLPLQVGRTFNLKISDSGLVYDIPVKVTGRERQKTEIGRVMCYRVEPDVFGAGRLIERDGSMVIWVTDDARRIPVRARVKTSFGKLEIKLRSITPSRQSITPPTKD
jgi:hypothetical protein